MMFPARFALRFPASFSASFPTLFSGQVPGVASFPDFSAFRLDFSGCRQYLNYYQFL